MKKKTCAWKNEPKWNLNKGEMNRQTQCGRGFYFTNDTTSATAFKFCPFCGRKIKEAK